MIKYYYVRDKYQYNKPVITVCLLKNNEGIVSRGISVCSIRDNPSKKTGRGISLSRARKANGTKSNHDKPLVRFNQGSEIIFEVERLLTLNKMSLNEIDYLYSYDATLGEFEKRLMDVS